MHGFFMDIRLYHKVNKADLCQFLLLTIKCVLGFWWGGVVFFVLWGFFPPNNGLSPVLMVFSFYFLLVQRQK